MTATWPSCKCRVTQKLMYRSNRSFNMPPPGHLTFLKIIVQIPPYPGQNAVQMPHTRVHLGDQMPPPPGTFHGHKNDRRTAETPSVVEQNLYKYNKNWATLLAYLLTKVSCKAAEIAATRSLNAQLFFVMQHTKRSIKKRSHQLRPFQWHASSLTLLINMLAVDQSSWPFYFILFHFML